MGRQGRRLVVLAVANLAFLAVVWLLETFIAERHWLTTLITYSPQQWVGVPSALLLIWALIRRAWLPVGLVVPALCIFYFALLGPAIPFGNRPILSDNAANVRLMTWNVHSAFGGVDNVIAAVRREHPDIVCFQEANDGHWNTSVLPALRKEFAGWNTSAFGDVATFSHYPIATERVHRLMPGSGRIALETVVDVDGQWLTVYNVHLNVALTGRSLGSGGLREMPAYLRHTAQVRMDQIRDLEKVASTAVGEAVMVGDFNTPPRGLCYGRIVSRYRDVFKREGSGLGYTYPAGHPLMRIDYIFADADVAARRCFVLDVVGSDHRPLIADLIIPRKER